MSEIINVLRGQKK